MLAGRSRGRRSGRWSFPGARRRWMWEAAPDQPPLRPKWAELAEHRRVRRGLQPSLRPVALRAPALREGWRVPRNPGSTDNRRQRSIKCREMYWMWSIPARSRTRADSAGRDCPHPFHAGRALDEPKRAKSPKANGAPLMPPACADRPDAAPEEDPCSGSGRRPPSSSRASRRTRPGPDADSCGRPGKSGRPSSAA